jgi:hypothetical protein
MRDMQTIAAKSWHVRVLRENIVELLAGILSLALALATAGNLCHVVTVLRRNPFGWWDTADLGVAVMCVFASWGFYRFLADLCRADGLRLAHPGHLAWWLSGGVWVMACGVELVVEGSSHESNAVASMINLAALLAVPLLPPLLFACLRRPERVRAGWRAWAGFVAAGTFPIQYLLFILLRD